MNVFDSQWLSITIAGAAPLLYPAAGEILAQRSGIVNVGLEGMMLLGAFFGFVIMAATGSAVAAFAIGAASGCALAAVMAVVTVRLRADQVVVGIALDIFALGLTGFLFEALYSGARVRTDTLRDYAVPGLSGIPYLGPGLFTQPPVVYGAFVAVAIAAIILCWTRLGLSITAVGDAPHAAELAGLRVLATRSATTLVTGALAGIGGAFLSVGQVGQFVENMTNGRGYLVFAAVIVGQWTAKGALGACLLFAGAEALEVRLQGLPTVPQSVWIVVGVVGLVSLGRLAYVLVRRRANHARPWRGASAYVALALMAVGVVGSVDVPRLAVPSQIWLAFPYVVAIVVLASVRSRRKMPLAFAQPYRREDL